MIPTACDWSQLRLPVAAAAIVCLVIVFAVPLLADGMLYYPQAGSRRAPEGMRKIRGPDGTEVAVLHLPNPQARFTLWFFHGNAEDLGDIEPQLRVIRDAGFAVFALDYPGYGHSGGKPSEASLYAASRVGRDYLRKELQVPAERTIVYGRSLGSGPAVQMAVEERLGGLVVQSGFMSAYRVITRWPLLPFDQFRNLAKLPAVTCPVLIMHGERDKVIPFVHGETLWREAREPKLRLWIPDAGHNDLAAAAGQKYWRTLEEFSELCAQTSARR